MQTRSINIDSMFSDQLKTDDEVLADKALQIKEQVVLHNFPLAVAAAVEIESQITISECRKAKKQNKKQNKTKTKRKFKDAC